MVVNAYNNSDLSLTQITTPINLAATIDGNILAEAGGGGLTVKAFVYNGYLYVFQGSSNNSIYPQSKPLPFLQF